uniref:J domain-containing protein n=1 Tax=Macrostomum lignano TaxID=282301 RepID=A0A1I8JNM1_9PLAT
AAAAHRAEPGCSAGNTDCLAEAKLRFDSWRLKRESINSELRQIVYTYGLLSRTRRRCGTSCGSATGQRLAAERERLLRALAMSRNACAGETPAGLLAGPRPGAPQDFVTSSATLEPTPMLWRSSGLVRLHWDSLLKVFGPEDRRLGAIVPGFARQFNDEFHLAEPSRCATPTPGGFWAAGTATAGATVARKSVPGEAESEQVPDASEAESRAVPAERELQVKLRAEQCQVKLRAEQRQVKLRSRSQCQQCRKLNPPLSKLCKPVAAEGTSGGAAEPRCGQPTDRQQGGGGGGPDRQRRGSLAGSKHRLGWRVHQPEPHGHRRGVRLAAVRPAAGARPLPMRERRAAQPARAPSRRCSSGPSFQLLRMVSELEKLAALELRLEASDSELEELAAAYPRRSAAPGWRRLARQPLPGAGPGGRGLLAQLQADLSG